MTIDWDGIKGDVAVALSTALAEAQGQAFAAFPIPATPIAATYDWDGEGNIETDDTSEVTLGQAATGDPLGSEDPFIPPSYVRLDKTEEGEPEGAWYKVIGIVENESIQVEDTYGIGEFPEGDTGSSKSDGAVPDPPSSEAFEDKLAVPIANALLDGVKEALDQAQITDVTDGSDTVGPGVIS